MATKFAVFDIDGTIIRTALFLQIVDELIGAGKLDAKLGAKLDSKLEAYRTRAHRDAFSEYNQTTFELFIANLGNLKVADFRAAADAVVMRSHAQVYVYTRELIKSLKSQDYFLIAISGSEQYTIEHFTKYYGFDVVIGDRYREKDGRFTGEYDSVFFEKGAALKRIVSDNRLGYKDSIGIGDSHGDVGMLELTERPIAFNPEAKLFQHARQKGWPIVIERKNVIYKLQPRKGNDGQYILA